MAASLTWKRRFTTPTIDAVRWSTERPNRLGVVIGEGSARQAWSWDLATGERRVVSTAGVGAEEVHALPDGSGVVWWLDELGDERGHWMVTPFGQDQPHPLVPSLADAWAMGISTVAGTVAVGMSTDDDYVVIVQRGDEAPVERYRHPQPAGVGQEWPQGPGGLSADGTLLCIRHAEEADIVHPALRVLDVRSGDVAGEQHDPGRLLGPAAWSPVAGDARLAIVHERPGIERPAVWDLVTGERTDVALPGMPGPVVPLAWYPDASALLLRHDVTGEQQLLRYELATGDLTTVLDTHGTISETAFRPDGTLWFRIESSVEPPSIRNLDGEEVLTLGGDPPPPGRPFRAISFENPHGQTIHGFVVTPDGSGPFPTIVSIHGGPEYHHTDAWDPHTQAFVDHGFAVVLVNYRGSTGYGRAHREAIRGNIGFPESEDVVAALDHVIASGIAEPNHVFLEGWSWGGYLANLLAGTHPDRWRAVVAGIPAGDYVAAHYESAPSLRAWDLAVMGGSPMDLPALYHERNPMTYVENVMAPTLIIAGEHDSRCPLGQVMVHAHALKRLGKEVDVHLYRGGHHANDVNERIRHVELTMDFFSRHLAG